MCRVKVSQVKLSDLIVLIIYSEETDKMWKVKPHNSIRDDGL